MTFTNFHFSLCLNIVYCALLYVHSSFVIILIRKKELEAFLVSRDCCKALPRGAMGLSAVCDCGIS